MQTTLKQTAHLDALCSGNYWKEANLFYPWPVDDLYVVWRAVLPFLSPAIERANGIFTEDDIFNLLLEGQMQLFVGGKAAIVTEIWKFPRLKVCRVVLAGGDLEEIRRKQPAFEAWAKARGCSRIEIDGRDGWARALVGYQKVRVVLQKELRP